MKKKTPLINTAVRLDGDKVKRAQKLGVDVPALFRDALDKALLAGGRCPMCKRKLFDVETEREDD